MLLLGLVKEPTVGKTIIVRTGHFGSAVKIVRITPHRTFTAEVQPGNARTNQLTLELETDQ